MFGFIRPGDDSSIRGMEGRVSWVRLIAGLVIVFALFQWLGNVLHSDRGQAGLLIGLIVVGVTLGFDHAFFSHSLRASARALGLGLPALRGITVAIILCLTLIMALPLVASIIGGTIEFQPKWLWLVPGLFAQAGVAEETLFRGFLFGHVRRAHSFWRAAFLSSLPFTAVHLILFLSMPWPIALAALLLAVIMSFPLAYLFELGGGTIWAPALLHFVVQGAVKVITISEQAAVVLPLIWMGLSAVVPFLVFVVPRKVSSTEAAGL